MKFLGYLFAAVLILLGVMFLAAAGAANTVPRLVIGSIIMAGGIGLIVALRMRVPDKRIHLTQKIDFTGDVNLEQMKCKSCGGTLDRDSIKLREGAIYVNCEYCKASYHMEEAPKWLAFWNAAAPPKGPKLKSYRIEKGEFRARVHLREEPDGAGLMIINASVTVHLNATALDIARGILEGGDFEAVLSRIREKYSDASEEQVRKDHDKVREVIFPSSHIEDRCPWESLASSDAAPFSRKVSAPYRADLALTYACGNACGHCYVERDKGMKSLGLPEWKRVLDKVWEAGIPHVCFTGGEATECGFLVELIEHAEDLGLVTGLLTHGRKLKDKKYVERLLDAGLDHIQITLESHEKAVHDKMVGAEAFDETVEGIKNALAGDVYVITNTTLTRLNADGFEGTIDFLHELGLKAFACNSIIYSGGGETSGIGLNEDELAPLLGLVSERARKHGMRFIWYTPTRYCDLNPTELDIGYKRCTAGEYNVCVEPNGDVIPCQSYYKAAGNILKDPWDRIWGSRLFREFRERSNVPDECPDCPDFEVCGAGCPLEREKGSFTCRDSTSEG